MPGSVVPVCINMVYMDDDGVNPPPVVNMSID